MVSERCIIEPHCWPCRGADPGERETALRNQAEQTREWHIDHKNESTVALKLLAINDFHSQITAGLEVDGRPVGSAQVLAAYLKAAEKRAEGSTFLVHAGDHVGASQPQSSLLQDEPGIMFFNMLGNEQCHPGGRFGAGCNLVGIPGNHELDEGLPEMLRLINGGNHAQGPYIEDPYKGANFPYICANLLRADTGKPVFQPYVIRMVDGIPVAFIGAILQQAGVFLPPENLRGLTIVDEAEAINTCVRQLHDQGIHTIIAVMHQGGVQLPDQDINKNTDPLIGDIAPIIQRLDKDVDVVLAGHTHTFHNVLVDKGAGRKLLVAQAWPKGTGYADINLRISRTSGDVVSIQSHIVTTWADQGPGLSPDVAVAALTRRVEEKGNALAEKVIASTGRPISRAANEAGESALGDLVADAQRHAMGADFAFINLDGLQADIAPGRITKSDQYSVQPYHLNLIKLELTGRQIHDLLNQQWTDTNDTGRRLQVSGLTYTWDARRPAGQRIIRVMKDGQPLLLDANYTVAVNEYLAGGGENLTVLTHGVNPVVGPFVADALCQYIEAHPQPMSIDIEGRISRVQ